MQFLINVSVSFAWMTADLLPGDYNNNSAKYSGAEHLYDKRVHWQRFLSCKFSNKVCGIWLCIKFVSVKFSLLTEHFPDGLFFILPTLPHPLKLTFLVFTLKSGETPGFNEISQNTDKNYKVCRECNEYIWTSIWWWRLLLLIWIIWQFFYKRGEIVKSG